MTKQEKKQPPKVELDSKKVQNEKPLNEFVIKEIMIQKGISREDAIKVLENPSTEKAKK